MAPDLDHIDVVLFLILKLLTGTESPNLGVVQQDLVRLTTDVR